MNSTNMLSNNLETLPGAIIDARDNYVNEMESMNASIHMSLDEPSDTRSAMITT